MTKVEFGKTLKRLRPGVVRKKLGPKGRQDWHYVGIALKP